MDRMRGVHKGFDKLAKKKGKKIFKPSTWGFDIEFNYYSPDKQFDELLKLWKEYIKTHKVFYNKFIEEMSNKDEYPGYNNIESWISDNDKNGFDEYSLPHDNYQAWVKNNYNENNYNEKKDIALNYYNRKSNMIDSINYWKGWEDNYLTDYASETISNSYDYIDIPDNSETKKNEYISILEKLGEKCSEGSEDYLNFWNVHLDGGGWPEIASRILTTKDFGLVRKLLNALSDEETSNGTSAHLHIGMPSNFDMFSLLSLFVLVDEESIKNRLPTRLFSTFSKLSKNITWGLLGKLARINREGKVWKVEYKNDEIKYHYDYPTNFIINEIIFDYSNGIINKTPDYLKFKKLFSTKSIRIINKVVDKNDHGIKYLQIFYKWVDFDLHPKIKNITEINLRDSAGNIIINEKIIKDLVYDMMEKMSGINYSYLSSRNTIEFRYLSSDILNNIDEFFKYVNYFLYIPNVAEKAKRIRFGNYVLHKRGEDILMVFAPKKDKYFSDTDKSDIK